MMQTRAMSLLVLLGSCQGQMVLVGNVTYLTATTTQTPWDSSFFSSGSSDSLASSMSALSQGPGESSASSNSDFSGSFSWAGSEQSGSSGSFLRLWIWAMMLVLCCCLVLGGALIAFMLQKQKPRTKPQRSQQALPPLAPPMQEELLEQQVAPVQEYADMNQDGIPDAFQAPLPTYSTPIPSYSTPTYAAPATTAYMQSLQPQTVAMPMASPYTTSYAAPATSYMAAPAPLFPSTTSYATATPYGGSAYMGGTQAYTTGAYGSYAQPGGFQFR